MKKILILVLVLVCFLAITGLVDASGAPRRNSTKVDDVFKPYSADGWIISPDDEPINDQQVTNAPECDLEGVISCYDDRYLRVDILLHTGVSFLWDTLYGIRLEYDSMNEYYIYDTASGKLIYKKEKNGKIVETTDLTKDSAGDTAGITSSGNIDNSDIYLIINKANHISGKKGNRYFLTSYFYSEFYNEKGDLKLADDTIDVDLEFEY
jgi:hypothetical protein